MDFFNSGNDNMNNGGDNFSSNFDMGAFDQPTDAQDGIGQDSIGQDGNFMQNQTPFDFAEPQGINRAGSAMSMNMNMNMSAGPNLSPQVILNKGSMLENDPLPANAQQMFKQTSRHSTTNASPNPQNINLYNNNVLSPQNPSTPQQILMRNNQQNPALLGMQNMTPGAIQQMSNQASPMENVSPANPMQRNDYNAMPSGNRSGSNSNNNNSSNAGMMGNRDNNSSRDSASYQDSNAMMASLQQQQRMQAYQMQMQQQQQQMQMQQQQRASSASLSNSNSGNKQQIAQARMSAQQMQQAQQRQQQQQQQQRRHDGQP